jgi:hypothetical protein
LSDDLGFIHDHGQLSWDRWLAQHVGKRNTESFVKAFYPPLNRLDRALNDMYILRWLDTAIGRQLDGIGSIVGITRTVEDGIFMPFFGFTSQPSGRGFGQARLRRRNEPYAESYMMGDVEFRFAIGGKIAFNNGHGTAIEIADSVNRTLNVTRTRVFDAGNANARIYINDMILPNDPRFGLIDRMLPRAAGVKIWPYFVYADRTFGFANQRIYFGFGIGVLARRPGSNIPPILVDLSLWDNNDSIWDNGDSIWDERF